MKILCIENDPRILDLTVRRCRDLPQKPEVFGFCGEKEALAWLRQNGAASCRAAAAENCAGRRASARTFGEFDLFADGEAVSFPRSKAKELLAYLIDRQGGRITRAAAAAVLWEDSLYDRSLQKQLDVIVRSLRAALEKAGVGDVFEIRNGMMRVLPERLDCDLYRFLSGDAETIRSYRGEYMNAYSWADLTEAFLTRTQNRIK